MADRRGRPPKPVVQNPDLVRDYTDDDGILTREYQKLCGSAIKIFIASTDTEGASYSLNTNGVCGLYFATFLDGQGWSGSSEDTLEGWTKCTVSGTSGTVTVTNVMTSYANQMVRFKIYDDRYGLGGSGDGAYSYDGVVTIDGHQCDTSIAFAKLNEVKTLTISPDPVTVDEKWRFSCTKGSDYDPNIDWFYVNGSEDGINYETYHFTNSEISTATASYSRRNYKYFKVQAYHGTYRPSLFKEFRISPKVICAPQDMDTQGNFSVTFPPNTSVPLKESQTIKWNTFSPSLALGRFNYYKIQFISGSSTYDVQSGDNDSTQPNSVAVKIDETYAGLSYQIKVICCYKAPDGKIFEGQSFTSKSTYTVEGQPKLPEILFPVLSSANAQLMLPGRRVRLIFRVSGSLPVIDIEVKVSSSRGNSTYKYSNSSDKLRFYTLSSDKPSSFNSGEVVDFITPFLGEGDRIQIRTVSSAGGRTLTSSYTPSLVVGSIDGLDYVEEGKPLVVGVNSQQGSIAKLRTYASTYLSYYSEIESGLNKTLLIGDNDGLYSIDKGEVATSDPWIKTIQRFRLFMSRLKSQKLTNYHESTYNEVGVVANGDRVKVNFDLINFDQSNEIIKAEIPRSDYLSDNFYEDFLVDSSSRMYINQGNFFNYIVCMLKWML